MRRRAAAPAVLAVVLLLAGCAGPPNASAGAGTFPLTITFVYAQGERGRALVLE